MAKKIKIIRERVNTPFQEVKTEKKKPEKLEEEIEQDNFSNNNSFRSNVEITAPVLQSSNITQQTTQQRARNENNQNSNTNPNENTNYQTGVYNMPDYGNNAERRVQIQRTNTQPGIREERNIDLARTQQTFREQWGGREFTDPTKKYQEPIRPIEQEERRLPFSRTETVRRKRIM